MCVQIIVHAASEETENPKAKQHIIHEDTQAIGQVGY